MFLNRYYAYFFLSVFLLITGCSNQRVLPDTGPEILDVYERHIGGQKGSPGITTEEVKQNPSQPLKNETKQIREPIRYRADRSAFIRDPQNEIDNLFPTLPNPQIVIYVYPHMTKSNRPIPGYSTVTKMYDKDEYALPGEWVSNQFPDPKKVKQ